MASTEYDLNPVSRITTGAIGPAGQRVFYLQARQESTLVTLIVEKMQMQSLANGLEQFLLELAQQYPDLPEAAGDYASGPNHVLPTSGLARLRGGGGSV